MIEHKGKYAHHSYNGWMVECECGWVSKTHPHRADANRELEKHVASMAVPT